MFWGGRGQVSGFSHQRKGGYVYHNGQQSQRSNSNCLIYTEPWCWLVDQGVPRTETERKPIPFSLDMYKHKSPILRLTWIIKKKKRERQNTLIEFPVLNQCADPEHTELKGGWIPLRKNPSILTEMHTVNISAFPIAFDHALEKGNNQTFRDYRTLTLTWHWFQEIQHITLVHQLEWVPMEVSD